MKRRMCFFTLGLFFFLIGSARAGEKLSLKDALNMAYKKNPAVVSARKDMKIAEFQYKASQKWDNPEFEVEAGNLAKNLEGDSSFSTRNIDSEIRITQPVEGWGKKGLKKKMAANVVKQQEAELKRIWIETVQHVKEKYTRILLQKKAVDLAEEHLTFNQRFLDQIKMKFDSGEAAHHELSRARLEMIHARNQVLSARKEYVIRKGEFNLLLGQPIHTDYILMDYFQAERLDKSYEDLLKKALEQRADVFVQETEIENKENALKLAKRERWPSYGLSFFVEREDAIYKGGVGLAFELPLWNFNGNEIRQARLEKEKAENLLQQLKDEVTLEVYTAFHQADLAQKSHAISVEAIKEANEILKFTTLAYDEGEASFLAYLENIKAYQETKLAYFESLSEYAMRVAELEQVIGKVAPSEYNEEGEPRRFNAK